MFSYKYYFTLIGEDVRRKIRIRDRIFKRFKITQQKEHKLEHIIARREVNTAIKRYNGRISDTLSAKNIRPKHFGH